MGLLSCSEAEEFMFPYLDGETTDRESKRLQCHLDDCEACRRELNERQKMLLQLKKADFSVPAYLSESIMRKTAMIPQPKKQKLLFLTKNNFRIGTLTAACAVAVLLFLNRGQILSQNSVPTEANTSSDKYSYTDSVSKYSENADEMGVDRTDVPTEKKVTVTAAAKGVPVDDAAEYIETTGISASAPSSAVNSVKSESDEEQDSGTVSDYSKKTVKTAATSNPNGATSNPNGATQNPNGAVQNSTVTPDLNGVTLSELKNIYDALLRSVCTTVTEKSAAVIICPSGVLDEIVSSAKLTETKIRYNGSESCAADYRRFDGTVEAVENLFIAAVQKLENSGIYYAVSVPEDGIVTAFYLLDADVTLTDE